MENVTRVYDSYERARRTVNELEAAGVPPSDISLMANQKVSTAYGAKDDASNTATGAGVGAVVGGGAGLLAGLGMLAIPGVGPIVAAGWLAATAAGALAGGAAGGMVGALVDAGVPEDEAHVYSESVRRGKTLVSVRTNSASAERVRAIIDRSQPLDTGRLSTEYRNAGWKQFDPNAAPYELTEEEIERARRL